MISTAASLCFRERNCNLAYCNGSRQKFNCFNPLLQSTVSIRWFIVMIAFVGICCSIVGTALGALKASGREHLTVSLLMIGEFNSEWLRNSQFCRFCSCISIPGIPKNLLPAKKTFKKSNPSPVF